MRPMLLCPRLHDRKSLLLDSEESFDGYPKQIDEEDRPILLQPECAHGAPPDFSRVDRRHADCESRIRKFLSPDGTSVLDNVATESEAIHACIKVAETLAFAAAISHGRNVQRAFGKTGVLLAIMIKKFDTFCQLQSVDLRTAATLLSGVVIFKANGSRFAGRIIADMRTRLLWPTEHAKPAQANDFLTTGALRAVAGYRLASLSWSDADISGLFHDVTSRLDVGMLTEPCLLMYAESMVMARCWSRRISLELHRAIANGNDHRNSLRAYARVLATAGPAITVDADLESLYLRLEWALESWGSCSLSDAIYFAWSVSVGNAVLSDLSTKRSSGLTRSALQHPLRIPPVADRMIRCSSNEDLAFAMYDDRGRTASLAHVLQAWGPGHFSTSEDRIAELTQYMRLSHCLVQYDDTSLEKTTQEVLAQAAVHLNCGLVKEYPTPLGTYLDFVLFTGPGDVPSGSAVGVQCHGPTHSLVTESVRARSLLSNFGTQLEI